MARLEKTVVLEVTFSKHQPAQPLIDRLLEDGLHSVTVLRGRVTDCDSWYQLEIQGRVPVVDAAVESHRDDGICFTRFVPALA
jgi:hypothetical protein